MTPTLNLASTSCAACQAGDHSKHVAQFAGICIGCACPERVKGGDPKAPLPPGVKLANVPLDGWRVPGLDEIEVLNGLTLPEGTEIYVTDAEDDDITFFLFALPGKPPTGVIRFWAHNVTTELPAKAAADLIRYARPPELIDATEAPWLEGLRRARLSLGVAHGVSRAPFVAVVSGARWLLWTNGHIAFAGPTDKEQGALTKGQRGIKTGLSSWLFPADSDLCMEIGRAELAAWAVGWSGVCNVGGVAFSHWYVQEIAQRLDGDALRATRPSSDNAWVLRGATRYAGVMPLNVPPHPMLGHCPLRETGGAL